MTEDLSSENTTDFPHARAEASARALYQAAGMPAPRHIVWLPSPRALVCTPPPSAAGRCVKDQLDPSWHVRWEVQAGRAELRLLNRFRGASTALPVEQELWHGAAKGRKSVQRRIKDLCVYRHHIRFWALYEFFREKLQSPHGTDAAESLDFLIPHEKDSCFLSEPAVSMSTDSTGMLHSTTGPAITFRDGWKVYAVDGVWTPSCVIEQPEFVTIGMLPDGVVQRPPDHGLNILVCGTATAHLPYFKEDNVHLFGDASRIYVVIAGRPATLYHDEHMPMTVAPGIYEVRHPHD